MSSAELLDDALVQKHLRQGDEWVKLPAEVRDKFGNNPRSWKRLVIKWSLLHQLRWKTTLIRHVVADERSYYQELVKHSQENQLLYPYHLSDVLIKGLHISPFSYYRDMLLHIMHKDESYDILPNFTAADVHRLLGIGRNEYINIMNTSRTNRAFSLFKKKENQLEDLVPNRPCEIPLRSWWTVNIGYVSEEDIKLCDKVEHATIDMLLDCGATPAGKIARSVVSSLHQRGLIWLDIPISSEDFIIVTSLEKFVMNRVKGDFMEKLLYKIFVTIDDRTNVAQLAEILQVDEELVKFAISVFIRLGFAEKKNAEAPPGIHSSWSEYSALHGDEQEIAARAAAALIAGNAGAAKRIGFLFDSSLTAFLMMGNLAEGLKQHAVTLFEVGKLGDEQLDSFLLQLDGVQVSGEEGEARRYFEHAITLKETLRTLRKNPSLNLEGCDGALDMIRSESLSSLDREARSRVLRKNYAVLFSMCPMNREPPVIPSDGLAHFGSPVWEVSSPWWKMFVASLLGDAAPPTYLFRKGERIVRLPPEFARYPFVRVTKWDNESHIVPRGVALMSLNDLLLANPVLVQPYPSHEPHVFHVSFPLAPLLVDVSTPDAKAAVQYDRATIHQHPSVQLLARELHLEAHCGYIEMVEVDPGVWKPFDVVYGLPLFADVVAKEVLQRIGSSRLLSQEMIDKHRVSAADLEQRLKQYIRSFGSREDTSGNELPLPTSKPQ